MSATAISIKDGGVAIETAESCKIVVFYENPAARSGAMSVCDRLVEQFADDLDFEFKWLKFQRLSDPATSAQVTRAASTADIVMFCPGGSRLPLETAEWIETWAESGVKSDGAIALILQANVNPAGEATDMGLALKWAAKRLGMDFLQLSVPPLIVPGKKPVPSAAVALPALEQPHSNHWGLNE